MIFGGTKRQIVIGFLGIIIVFSIGIFIFNWMSAEYRPRAYIGEYTVEDGVAEIPSKIHKIDVEKGKITDTFPLTENVPIVQAIAVNWDKNRLYAGGDWHIAQEIPSRGIDVYDLDTYELVDRIDFGTERAKIDLIRFSPSYNRLFIDRPIPRREAEEKSPFEDGPHLRWVLDGESYEVLKPLNYALSDLIIISPNGEKLYRFVSDDSKIIYSVNKDTTTLKFRNDKERLKKTGGFQPDADKNFKLDYPRFINIYEPELYDRDTMEKIGTIDMSENDPDNAEFVRLKTFGPESWTKKRDYWVVPVVMEHEEKGGRTYVKIVDVEELSVKHTIPVGGLRTTHIDAH